MADDWGDLDARLERKKRVKLRRQQRELKKQQKQLDALEKERQKLALRCDEMAREDALSVAMMRFYQQHERQARRAIQREKDMQVYKETAQVRRRAQQLALPLETPGVSGIHRLRELTERVETKETAIKTALAATQRLHALPEKRSRVRRLLESFFASSARAKLERAVYESRCDAIVELLDPKMPSKRSDPSLLNHESENGLTPVLCTIYQGKLTLLRRLLELGASPDVETSTGMTPLLASVLVDNVVALHLLAEFRVHLAHETRGGVHALLFAADKGRNGMLKALLRLGVAVDDANREGRTALMQAAISGHFETTKILLAFGATKEVVDKSGRSAIDWARHWKFGHIVSLLGATISSKTLMNSIQEQEERELDAPNSLARAAIIQQSVAPGTVAMETALQNGNVGRILELLSVEDAGCGPNFESVTGKTALLVISREGSIEDILSCLQCRCSVTQCNREGINALMKAAYQGKEDIVQILIRAGCSPAHRDIYGRDVWRYLHDNEHHDLVNRLLKSHHSTTPPLLTLSQPVEEPLQLRSLLRTGISKSLVESNVSSHHPQSDERDGRESDEGQSDELPSCDEVSTTCDMESVNEWKKSQQWRIRRRVLRTDTTRNSSFEEERRKMWKYAQRGRRHGLIAPLPHKKAGRLKYPSCDNCKGNRARKRCFPCDQVQCDRCHARLHELPHRRHHDYEELEPTIMVGTLPVEKFVANQEESLKGALDRSRSCLEMIKETLLSLPAAVHAEGSDPEVEKFQRKERAIRQKEIAQVQINVPVSAAKHAIKAGEGDIYTNPAEIDLADLYITQGKLTKARLLMETTRRTTEDALGYSHPTMLKIQMRLARIKQLGGDLGQSLQVVQLALSTFESVLAADTKDLLVAQNFALQVLDTLARYSDAVELCRRIHRQRVIGLARSHPLVQQAQTNLDEFIAKREKESMYREDQLILEQAALSAEQAKERRAELEVKLSNFRSLLLDQTPPNVYAPFLAFAKREFAEEMVLFWVAVELAKTRIDEHDAKAFRAAVVSIFITYIKSRRIKIITAVQRKKMKKMITTPGKKIPRSIFDEVQALVFEVIYGRVFARFQSENRTVEATQRQV